MTKKEKRNATKLGLFLCSVRQSRGYSNINEYLRNYSLPISDVYYREIESGKRQVAMETASQLCEALQIDYADFYYYLLKDILPQEVESAFTTAMPPQPDLDQAALDIKKQKVQQAYQKNFVDRLKQRVGYMNAETEAYFHQHPQFMPFLTSIYCQAKTSEKELTQLLEKDCHNISIKQVLSDFQHLGLIKLANDPLTGSTVIERSYNYIIIRDQKLLAQRLLQETQLSISKRTGNSDRQKSDDLIVHGIVGLTEAEYQAVLTQLADLISEFRAAHGQGADLDPYLLTLLITPQTSYRLPG